MGFFSKLFKKKTKETETFTLNMFGKDVTVDISDQARAKYAARYKELEESAWEGDNEVERIRDDGYVIYKSNRVTSYEREQVGFYGLKWFSNNKKYCVVYLPLKDEEFNLCLVDVETKTVIFKKQLLRPSRCRVSNNGLIICEDWEVHDIPSCSVYVISKEGVILQKHTHKTGIGDVFDFFDNENKFKYNINSTGEINELKII